MSRTALSTVASASRITGVAWMAATRTVRRFVTRRAYVRRASSSNSNYGARSGATGAPRRRQTASGALHQARPDTPRRGHVDRHENPRSALGVPDDVLRVVEAPQRLERAAGVGGSHPRAAAALPRVAEERGLAGGLADLRRLGDSRPASRLPAARQGKGRRPLRGTRTTSPARALGAARPAMSLALRPALR